MFPYAAPTFQFKTRAGMTTLAAELTPDEGECCFLQGRIHEGYFLSGPLKQITFHILQFSTHLILKFHQKVDGLP